MIAWNSHSPSNIRETKSAYLFLYWKSSEMVLIVTALFGLKTNIWWIGSWSIHCCLIDMKKRRDRVGGVVFFLKIGTANVESIYLSCKQCNNTNEMFIFSHKIIWIENTSIVNIVGIDECNKKLNATEINRNPYRCCPPYLSNSQRSRIGPSRAEWIKQKKRTKANVLRIIIIKRKYHNCIEVKTRHKPVRS